MKAVVWLSAGALLITSCGGSERNLVTQTSMGPVRLGEPRSVVEADLGPGVAVRQRIERFGQLAGWTVTQVRYPGAHLGVGYVARPGGRPFAVLLVTAYRGYVASDGGRVGDSVERLRQLFGTRCLSNACFDGPVLGGVGFLIDHGRASAIEVAPHSLYQIRIWAAEA